MDESDEQHSLQYKNPVQDRRHSTDIFGDQQIQDTSGRYSVPLTNPSIYSNNNAISISKKYDLPSIFKQLVDESDTVRMDMSLQAKHMLMATANKAAILLHYRDINKQELCKTELLLPVPPQQTQPPFIRLILPPSIPETTTSTLDRNALAGLALVTKSGELYYWPRITAIAAATPSSNLVSFNNIHQIPLGHKEEIRCVTTADLPGTDYQMAVGTSIGNVYLVQIVDDSNGQTNISHISLYQHKIPSTIFGSIWSYYRSSVENDDGDIGGIIKILKGHSRDELVVLSSFYLQNWKLTPSNQPKLLSRIHLQSAIQDRAIPMLLPEIQAPNVRVRLLDIDKYGQTGWVVLVSYTIPEMGEFSQFALVCMEQIHTQQNNDIPLNFIHTYSLPYSIKLTTLKRRPSLHLSNGSIAYVSFDNAIVSTSINSRFEHTLALRNDSGNNKIMDTIVKEHDDPRYATSLVFTTGSGVLEYKVDEQYISKSRSEGNLFASDYEDENARDIALTRSKLEQAIFFGYSDENPLYFPVQLDRQQKLGEMVVSLAKDIANGDLELMPKTLDTQILLAQRIKFIQRIPESLKREGLLELVDENYWTDLWAILKACYIGLELKTFINENRTINVDLITCMERNLNAIAQDLMDQDNDNSTTQQLRLDDLIMAKVLLLPKCLEHLITQILEDGELGNVDPYPLVNSVGRLIYNIAFHVQSVERSFTDDYLESNELKSVFFSTSDIGILLHKNFTKVKTCLQTISDYENDQYVEMSKLLVDYSFLLLDVYRQSNHIDSSFAKQYQEERDFIIDTLWKLKNTKAALDLAKDHHYYSLLVAHSQAQSSDECQRLTEQYVQDYGNEFVRCLISFYSEADDEERLLHFDPMYDQLVSDVLNDNPKIGWKYHMQNGRYKEVYELLRVLLSSIDEIGDRKVLLSQGKLAYLATNIGNSDGTPISIILESSFMKFFSNNLELMEAQEQTLATFKDMALGQMVDELDEHVDLVILKAFSHMVDNEWITELEVIKSMVRQLLTDCALTYTDYVFLLSSMDINGSNVEHYMTALYFTGLYAYNNNQAETLMNLNRIWRTIYTKDDWESIDKCVKSRQGNELSRLLEQTTTYRVLLMCKKQNVMDELILRPGDVKMKQGDCQDKLLANYIQSHRLESIYFDECILAISL